MSEGVKNVIVIIYNLYDLVCWKIFYIWIKSILGNYETTLYSYFFSGDVDWYGCRWTDVHCFSIVDCRWHYSIGDVTFIMDQAKRNMEQAKYDLRNFSRELNDVNMACNLNIDTGDFLSFADYFFDGFVVDWVVQDRINNAQRQVEEAIRRTESIVNQLQRM